MRTHLDVFPEANDTPSGYMQGSGTAVLRVGGRLALFLDEAIDPADWLRRLAVTAEELAEQVELAARPGLALAEQHITEAKAAAGIGVRS